MRVIHHGDCLEVLRTMPDNSADGLLSDPPAGIGFMGKSWDRDKGGRDQWIAWLASVMREAHRVMKPGAYGLVWALPRTAHWTTMALEDAGFEVRDVVLHLFGSGFPKSLDVSKAIDAAAGAEREVVGVRFSEGGRSGTSNSVGSHLTNAGKRIIVTSAASAASAAWSGYGTALKPAAEHWILVRKKLDGTVAANVAKWGTGGIAIDACRIGETKRVPGSPKLAGASAHTVSMPGFDGGSGHDPNVGRWPANVTLDSDAAAMLDEQAGECPSGVAVTENGGGGHIFGKGPGHGARPNSGYSDNGGPSRFFYVAKTSTAERNFGCEHYETINARVTWENEVREVALLVDTEASPPRVICASSAPFRDASEWSTLLFGNDTTAPLLPACRFTIATKTSSITESKTWNWLTRQRTSDCTPDAASLTECGGNHARSVTCGNQSTETTGTSLKASQGHTLDTDVAERVTWTESLESIARVEIESVRSGSLHPTIKSISLTKWLATLIKPPGDGKRLLCPFAGSGGEVIGAMRAGWEHIDGIEQDADFVEIARARIARWEEVPMHLEPDDVAPVKSDERQETLFR